MPEVQKVSIALTVEQIACVKSAVKAGEYATTSEIVREALRDWQLKREVRGAELSRLREVWEQGKQSGTAMPVDFDANREQARGRLRKAKARAS